MATEDEDEPSYVYMFYSAGKIKIGTSKNPTRRLDQANYASSAPVQLVWVGLGDRRTEHDLHNHFRASRLHGEWFALSDDIRSFVFPEYLRAAERTYKNFLETI